MTPELLAVFIISIAALLNAMASGTINASIAGFAWGLGNRDKGPELPHWAIRLQRSHTNLIENLPSFIALVLIAHLMQISDPLTAAGAWTFVIARFVFVILYTTGVTILALRTVVWFASIAGMALIIWRILVSTIWSDVFASAGF